MIYKFQLLLKSSYYSFLIFDSIDAVKSTIYVNVENQFGLISNVVKENSTGYVPQRLEPIFG